MPLTPDIPDNEATGLSEYERKRQENIRRNQEMLLSLNFPPAPDLTPTKTPARKRKAENSSTNGPATPEPTRKSLRLRGLPARAALTESVDEEKKVEVKVEEEVSDPVLAREFIDLLASLKAENPSPRSTRTNTRSRTKTTAMEAQDEKELLSKLQGLRIRHQEPTVKVTPERIYSSAFHPSKEKILLCAGDKFGTLGIWDVNSEDTNDGEPIVHHYKAHPSTISTVMYSTSNNHRLYSASYDGTVKYLDVNQEQFVEAYSAKADDNASTLINNCLDIDPNNDQLVYISNVEGQLIICDVRSKSGSSTGVYQLHNKKIGGIHINPVRSDILITASNDRSMRVWDLRLMKKTPSDEYQSVASFEHTKAVTAAYWSSDGARIANTCFDDSIRIFQNEGDKFEKPIRISHNNRTGRWLTLFRPMWCPVTYQTPPFLIVGNMNRWVDVFSGTTGQLLHTLSDTDRITAVPAVNTFHPNMPIIGSANASGRMMVWS
ncbi:WD40 repeat-like protein [Basidiobolus meristosporus CBS 931.73]|uniref:DNA damage-binding protein CMR1 n=1 Tax=Basidiobolus meristosporus CBS 931.73 TaxID=1314790 RepID=A0A1Y1Y0J3_9FUNG|nr:WD40 repeat-like protein [Basidiobolus meristosporus CBS 931.73]|eukprot:ORX91415.1 WD40 repeat-like protein [Basidiobolus meristosporus CBS 931.73]